MKIKEDIEKDELVWLLSLINDGARPQITLKFIDEKDRGNIDAEDARLIIYVARKDSK
tara:strand:- start:661 stop:834 length:174 start_codon:yes stop_codon:yes gene_type:complete